MNAVRLIVGLMLCALPIVWLLAVGTFLMGSFWDAVWPLLVVGGVLVF